MSDEINTGLDKSDEMIAERRQVVQEKCQMICLNGCHQLITSIDKCSVNGLVM